MGKLGAIMHKMVGLIQRLYGPVTKQHFSSLELTLRSLVEQKWREWLLETLLKEVLLHPNFKVTECCAVFPPVTPRHSRSCLKFKEG